MSISPDWKSEKQSKSHGKSNDKTIRLLKITKPGYGISVDELESSIAGLIALSKGIPNT
jgi:hypothetical protein